MPKNENAFVSCLKPYYFNDTAKMTVILSLLLLIR